jgi:hypothetical protein
MKKQSIDSLFAKRYFTRDCSGCPFWDNGCCSMVSNCSTFEDLFSGGRFYSALSIAKTVSPQDVIPSYLQSGHFVDCDGVRVHNVTSDGFETVMEVVNNVDLVGVLVPVETDN